MTLYTAAPAVRPWAPRAALMPLLSGDLISGLVAESNGSPGCYGGWELVYPASASDEYVEFHIKVRWHGLQNGFESLSVEANWENEQGSSIDWAPVTAWETAGEWLLMKGKLTNTAGAARLVIKLLLRWSATGRVEWQAPKLLPTTPPQPRVVRLAAASIARPPHTLTMEENRERILTRCRQAGESGVDILCLPEVILSWGLQKPPEGEVGLAIEIPGPFLAPFCQLAQQYHMALCFSAWERENELVFNTAVLINPQGEIAAKYRKVHLAVPYEAWSGITPGSSFPVATVGKNQARVGMNICMDSSAVESARALARAGAEVVLLPIMGDHRADRWTRGTPHFDFERWLLIHRMRALDNHIYLVAARNDGVGSGIFAPNGDVLAVDGGDQRLVWADVDLNDLKQSWTGATFKDVCWFERRESVYDVLAGKLQPTLHTQSQGAQSFDK